MIRFAHRRVSLVVDGSKTRASSSSIISSLCQREQYCVWYIRSLTVVKPWTWFREILRTILGTVPEAHRPLPTRENWDGALGVNSALYVLKKDMLKLSFLMKRTGVVDLSNSLKIDFFDGWPRPSM